MVSSWDLTGQRGTLVYVSIIIIIKVVYAPPPPFKKSKKTTLLLKLKRGVVS